MAQETSTMRSGSIRAEEIKEANRELVAFIESCSGEDWGRICEGEGWSVGAVAHHIAWGHERAVDWIRAIRDGRDVPGSPEAHDASNKAMAAQGGGKSREEVIQLANQNVTDYAQLLRSLDAADFPKSARFGPGGGMTMSVDRLAGARRHLDQHLSSMRAAVGR